MWILAFNITHDSSVTLLKNSEVVFHIQEERITHKKFDPSPLYALKKLKSILILLTIVLIVFYN